MSHSAKGIATADVFQLVETKSLIDGFIDFNLTGASRRLFISESLAEQHTG